MRYIGTSRGRRATIFRTIKLLVDESVVYRVFFDDDHHRHVNCRACGMVGGLSGCGTECVLAETLDLVSFSMNDHWREVSGRCGSHRDMANN